MGRRQPVRLPPERRTSLRALTRMLLYAAQDGRCFYCALPLDPARLRHVPPASCAPDDPTLDHVQPASKGGAGDYENLVLACRACNERKGDGPPPRPEAS